MPVTRDPTEVITEPGDREDPLEERSFSCSTRGSRTTRKPSTFARIQPGRSTTATRPSEPPGPADIPVTSKTGCCTAPARSRSSETVRLASARLTCGPGRAHRVPVEMARSQSIICALLTVQPYVLRLAPVTANPADLPRQPQLQGPASRSCKALAA